jgi:hypothetical protein
VGRVVERNLVEEDQRLVGAAAANVETAAQVGDPGVGDRLAAFARADEAVQGRGGNGRGGENGGRERGTGLNFPIYGKLLIYIWLNRDSKELMLNMRIKQTVVFRLRHAVALQKPDAERSP